MIQHLQFLKETGRWEQFKRHDAAAKLRELITMRTARTVMDRATAAGDLDRLTAAVAERTLDPYTAAEEVLQKHLGT